jgi:hypothetical protein
VIKTSGGRKSKNLEWHFIPVMFKLNPLNLLSSGKIYTTQPMNAAGSGSHSE